MTRLKQLNKATLAKWTETKEGYRWERGDGAVAIWDNSSPYPNPVNPLARLWTAWLPGDNREAITRKVGSTRTTQDGRTYRLGVRVRFKTAQAAMARLDAEFPIK